jgi:predicted tellurium resistance membrane protein TerC
LAGIKIVASSYEFCYNPHEKRGGAFMGKFLAIVGGLIAMAAGVWLVIVWWRPFYELVLGCIPPVLFFSGLIALIAGISSIKDAARTKKLEEEAKAEEKKA